MFQPKKTEEAESDSDWDSLPGDEPDPSSSPEATPRHQPVPPSGAPKGQVPLKRPQIKSQAALATPEKTSAANSPASLTRAKPATPTSHTPNQLYGKPGVTSFVDRSINGVNATTFTDRDLDSRKNKEFHPPDLNENRVQQSSQGRGDDGINIEMNDVGYHQRNPPFTDFQAALPKQDSPRLNVQIEKHKGGKVKSSYVSQKDGHSGNHSWDSDSDAEQDPVSHSRQHLTPREKNNSKKLKRHQEPNNLASEAVAEDQKVNLGLKTCCVPLDTQNQVNGCSYRFDHGHNTQLDVSPEWKEAYMKKVADRSEKWLHYFWQEFFSTVRIITDFAFIFVLELLRFIFHYVVLRVLGGIMILTGDHFLKPLLAVLFNSIIQPSFIFTRNILAGVKNLLQPLMDITNGFLAQLSSLLRAFRLFELNWKPVYERGQKHDVHVL